MASDRSEADPVGGRRVGGRRGSAAGSEADGGRRLRGRPRSGAAAVGRAELLGARRARGAGDDRGRPRPRRWRPRSSSRWAPVSPPMSCRDSARADSIAAASSVPRSASRCVPRREPLAASPRRHVPRATPARTGWRTPRRRPTRARRPPRRPGELTVGAPRDERGHRDRHRRGRARVTRGPDTRTRPSSASAPIACATAAATTRTVLMPTTGVDRQPRRRAARDEKERCRHEGEQEAGHVPTGCRLPHRFIGGVLLSARQLQPQRAHRAIEAAVEVDEATGGLGSMAAAPRPRGPGSRRPADRRV